MEEVSRAPEPRSFSGCACPWTAFQYFRDKGGLVLGDWGWIGGKHEFHEGARRFWEGRYPGRGL